MNEIVIKIIMQWANKVCQEVYTEWGKHNGVKGKADIDFKIVQETANMIVGQFQATGQKAWICEFGKGSLMRSPNIAAYQQSKYWNPRRNGNAVQGRPIGTYLDLDDNIHTSSGKNAGKDLEKAKIEMYKALPPKKIIHNIIMDRNNYFWQKMIIDLEKAIAHYTLSVIMPRERFTMRL